MLWQGICRSDDDKLEFGLFLEPQQLSSERKTCQRTTFVFGPRCDTQKQSCPSKQNHHDLIHQAIFSFWCSTFNARSHRFDRRSDPAGSDRLIGRWSSHHGIALSLHSRPATRVQRGSDEYSKRQTAWLSISSSGLHILQPCPF